jgi:hypothetical protein
LGKLDATTARAVAMSSTCCSIVRAARAEVAISVPIAASEAANTASAIRASMMVKPAPRPDLKHTVWNNLDPSGQPIDANVISGCPSGKDDGAAA